MQKKISILLVDDSPFFTTQLRTTIEQHSSFEVVVCQTQPHGEAQLQQKHFDLVLWDIMMLTAPSLHLLQLDINHRPLWLLRSTPTEALRWQSIDPEAHTSTRVISKPSSQKEMIQLVNTIDQQITLMVPKPSRPVFSEKPVLNTKSRIMPKVIGIAVSTGGPPVLERILSQLPADYPIPILIVQHISAGFMDTFTQWLGDRIALPVGTVTEKTPLQPGVWLAPDNAHMLVHHGNILLDRLRPPVQFAKPSGDVLLESIGQAYKHQSMGIVLTGLGQDGARGLKVIQENGGRIVIQEPTSCTIDGMVQASLKQCSPDAQLSPLNLATYLLDLALSPLGKTQKN